MAPIDYSKWDNIDTDSEPESPQQQQPVVRGKPPAYAASPQPAPLQTTGESTSSESIQAVIVRCDVERRKFSPWSAMMIYEHHPVFSNSVPDIPRLIEVPLVIHRVGTESINRAHVDNQIATYLNIDPESGFAPPAWQSNVGTVVVARKDKKPLLPHHLEGVWMYCDHILDLFGEGEGAPRSLYNRPAFEKWWAGYCEEQKEFRPGKGGEKDPDDWRVVMSPYEM